MIAARVGGLALLVPADDRVFGKRLNFGVLWRSGGVGENLEVGGELGLSAADREARSCRNIDDKSRERPAIAASRDLGALSSGGRDTTSGTGTLGCRFVSHVHQSAMGKVKANIPTASKIGGIHQGPGHCLTEFAVRPALKLFPRSRSYRQYR